MKVKREQGFNLIEMMVVVAIIGILAAIAIPSYSHYVDKSRAMSAVVLTDPARIAVTDYAMQNHGDLAGVSNTSLDLSSEQLVNGSKDVAAVVIQSVDDNTVAITATLANAMGSLIWTGSYDPDTGNMSWQCTFPANDPVAGYAPAGCRAA